MSGLPLSFAQQRQWFLDQLLPAGSAYTFSAGLRLRGPLDISALRWALQRIVDRHEALRTTFPAAHGEPSQRVVETLPVELPVHDLVRLPAIEREAEARATTEGMLRRPFDLARGPLFRAELLRLDDQEHILALSVHHIVFDSWSLGVLYDELSALYTARLQDQPSPLSALAVQYADYTHWQRAEMAGTALDDQLAYWRQRLSGAPTLLDLPTDRSRPAIQGFVGRAYTTELPASVRHAGTELQRRRRITPFMSLLAGYAVLLSRLTGSTDLVIGAPIAGRRRSRFEPLIGFFVNTLALRIDLTGDPTFEELLERVRGVAIEAFAHQDVPFEKLVEELRLERAMSHNPLVQAMFTLQNTRLELPAFPGLDVERYRIGHDSAFVDLWLEVVGSGAEGRTTFRYKSELFDDSTVRRMSAQFTRLLEAGLADPDRRLSRLPMLSGDERSTILSGWSRGGDPYASEPTVIDLIARQAARNPDAVAVTFRDHDVSYADMVARADRLAGRLRLRGVRADSVVGMCLPRSDELVVSILGVLRSAAAYLPLDPTDPPARMIHMLRTAGARHVLTSRALAHLFSDAGVPVLAVDEADADDEAVEPTPISGPAPDNLAYVIYTSGSTGRPKGVAVPHRGLVNRILWMQDAFGLTPDDRVLQKTPYTFDVSVWEFVWPLVAGARLVVAEPERHRDPAYLLDVIERQRITTVHFVPAMLAAFLEQPDLTPAGSLLRIMCSGEALTEELQNRCHDRLAADLHNLYGPTEASIDVTWWACGRESPPGPVPIGRPIAGVEAYVVDRNLEPVPVGTPGELLLGGACLARGYLGRADLTADRFRPHPFSAIPGARVYTTGDLVRWREEGVIEYLRRTDDQVKVRGYRIEPGEVEAVLRDHPAVHEAVVRPRPDQNGNPVLVAYIVPDPQANEVRAVREGAVTELTASWTGVFDQAFGEVGRAGTPLTSYAGWNSSYTGLPISDGEMGEWAEQTASRILSCGPLHVLEIGCGTGQLLFRIAPHCERYSATDVSAAALDYVREHLDPDLRGSRVQLRRQPANDLSGLDDERFDVVILNSVIQYFPSADYLRSVLEQVVERVSHGGVVFIGDVRHHGLLEAFHASVALHQASASDSLQAVRDLVARRVLDENELAVDPGLFEVMPAFLPRVGSVEVLLKRGRHHNELNRFRYDVLLRIGKPPEPGQPARMDWADEGLRLDALSEVLEADHRGRIRFEGVPNARVAGAVRLAGLLRSPELEAEPVGALRDRLGDVPSGVDPEALAGIAEGHGYQVSLTWSKRGLDAFDAVLHSPVPEAAAPGRMPRTALVAGGQAAWASYTNDPLRVRLEAELAPSLRAHCAETLPEYLVPARLVVLDRLPLSRSGKLDVTELPAPGTQRPNTDTAFVAPRGRSETMLAEVWAEILGLDRVGAEDNFFELGGDSLRSIQVVARAAEVGLSITPTQVFQHPTVTDLAAHAEVVADDEPPEALALTAVQSTMLTDAGGDAARLNRLLVLQPDILLDGGLLRRAFAHLLARHEALTMRLDVGAGTLSRVRASTTADESVVELVDLAEESQPGTAMRALVERSLAGLDVTTTGPLRMTLVELGAGRGQRLVVAASTLLLDDASLDIALDELLSDYERLAQRGAVRRGEVDIRFGEWLQTIASTPSRGVEPKRAERSVGELPEPEVVTETVGESEVRALTDLLAPAYRMSLDEVLLAALVVTLSEASGETSITVEVERSQRPGTADDSRPVRAVGQFKVRDTVRVELDGGHDLRLALASIKEQLRRETDDRPTPLVRYHAITSGGHGSTWRGRMRVLRSLPGSSRSVSRILDVAPRMDDALEVTISGHRDGRMAPAPTEIGRRLTQRLGALITHARDGEPGLCTPSDFPLASLDPDSLGRLFGAGRDIEDVYPLGPLQEWMLWRHLNQPRPGLYVGHSLFALDSGEVQPDALERAWQAVVDRHAVLRTSFVWQDVDEPLQVVHRSARLPFGRQDWRDLDPDEKGQRLDELVAERRLAGFDLTRAPHLRIDLVRWDEQSYRFVLTVHYMVLDGWSYPLVLQEAIRLHDALRRGDHADMPVRPPFRDYVAWVLARDRRATEDFWRRTLQGVAPAQLVAADGSREPDEPARYLALARRSSLPVTATTALVSQARRHRLTLYTLVQGAWALLLHSRTGAADVVFGQALSGRPPGLTGADHIVGYCTLHLPVRVAVDPTESLLAWLRKLQADQLAAREEGFCSLPRIKHAAGLPANRDLYDTCLIYLDLPPDPAGPRPRGWRWLDSNTNTEHVLRLVVEAGRSLQIGLGYCPHDLDEEQVDGIMREVHALLTAMTRSLDGSVGELVASTEAAVR